MQADFNLATSRFTFSDPEVTGTTIENALAWASYRQELGGLRQVFLTGRKISILEQEVMDVHGACLQWTALCPANQEGIELTYHAKQYHHQPFLLLQLSICNLGAEPIYLHELCLYQASPTNHSRVRLQVGGQGLRFFKVGWHGWDYTGWRSSTDRNQLTWTEGITRLSYSNPATPKPARRGEFCSEGWSIIEGANAAIVTGLASSAHQFGQVFANLIPSDEALSLICQADDIRLDPGESYDSDWGYLHFVPLPNSSPETAYLEAVARQMHARVPASPPPLMWTHWYQFYHEIDEQRFLQNLDSLAQMAETVPFQVAELDDGYQSAWGDWLSTNPKFRHGLEWLAKEISNRDFTPGLWLAPFTVQRNSRLAGEHPDWMVRDKHGKPARAGFLYNMFIYALDLTRPEVLDHLQQLSHNLTNDWGFKLLKIDFLNSAALPGKRYNPKMTRAEALRSGLEAVRMGAGEETFLLGCGCPFGPAIGVVDAMRIGPDTAHSWEPYFHWLAWSRPLIKSNPSMPALRNAMRNTLELSSLNHRWWWNDPDCLLMREVDTYLTTAETQSMVSLVGLSGGMLVSSDDMSRISDERMQWLTLLIPNLGLRGTALHPDHPGINRVYRVKVERTGQVYQLLAMLNAADKPAEWHLKLSELGYTERAKMCIYDFWNHQCQRVTGPELVFENIPAHGCKLLRLCEEGPLPQLLADTLHISQGLELSSVRIADKIIEIETIDLGRRVEGELWWALGKRPSEARCNGRGVNITEREEGVYVLQVEFIGKALIEIDL